MILGTANFGKEYRGYKVPEGEVYKIIDYFTDNGGEYINIAGRYCINHKDIIYMKKNGLKLLWNDDNSETSLDAIYYPHQISCYAEYISIPNSDIFKPYLDIMKLHSKVLVRSVFTLPESDIWEYADDVIIGCDNIEQLKENMERFK